jgi:hypothetical protein
VFAVGAGQSSCCLLISAQNAMHGSKKQKGHHPLGGDGLRGTRLLVGCRLHHPGVVGTSMPTLIRTRVVAASDIHRIMPQLSVPEAEHSGRLFSSDVTVKAGRGVI